MAYQAVSLAEAQEKGKAAYLADPQVQGEPSNADALTTYLLHAERQHWTLVKTLDADGGYLIFHQASTSVARILV